MNYKFDADRPFIFISYSHADEDLVNADVERLSKYGVNLWYDVNMSEGYSWEEYAKPKIIDEDCMAVLFYASFASLISKPCYEELRFAKETFDKFTNEELKKERDFNRHSLIKQKSKKIISVDLMNGSIPSVIEALLASAKTNTSIIGSDIEFIKNYIFQDFKVLYSVYKDDGEHIDKLLMRSLKELPKDVVVFNSGDAPHAAPPVPALASPVSELVCYETASDTLQAVPADSPNSAADVQNRFRNWLLETGKPEADIKEYINQLSFMLVNEHKAERYFSVDLFEYQNVQKFEKVYETLQSLPGFDMRNSSLYGCPKAALNAYLEFLKSIQAFDSLQPEAVSAAAHTFNHTITNTDATYGLICFKQSTGINELLLPNMPVTLIYKDVRHDTKVHSVKLGRISNVPFVRNIPVGTKLSVDFDGVSTFTLTNAAP